MADAAERELPLRHARAGGGFALRRLVILLALLGPGLITGIADDDATGVAGYSVAGARFGYDLLWAVLLVTISLAITFEMAARMGLVTGKGLADLIRERFGVRITVFAMATLLAANAATTIAEFAGIAAFADIFGISRWIVVPLAALALFLLVSRGTYRRIEIVLLIVSLVFVSYIITGFMAKPDWGEVAHGATVPTIKFNLGYLTMLIGIIGTTITPWQQFYLQSTTVDRGRSERDLKRARTDALIGAVISDTLAFFIVVTTAATLFVHGKPADTVGDVALSLEPLAGSFAERLFAIGLLNASLIAAAVLPLSTAYAICEAFGWERSASRPIREAPVFFGLFGGLLAIGAIAVLIPGAPLLTLLILPNVLGALLLPIILVLALILINDARLMGRWRNNRLQNLLGAGTTVVLVVLAATYGIIAILEAAGVVSS